MRLKRRIADLQRWIGARSRPTGTENARELRERGESLDTIVFRDAVAADIPNLAELHVTTWNATYHTSKGPTIATRTWQWNQVSGRRGWPPAGGSPGWQPCRRDGRLVPGPDRHSGPVAAS